MTASVKLSLEHLGSPTYWDAVAFCPPLCDLRSQRCFPRRWGDVAAAPDQLRKKAFEKSWLLYLEEGTDRGGEGRGGEGGSHLWTSKPSLET